jgi:hypothetical protein
MRDGVRLRADVMRPAGPGPFPVLVYRTPYDKEQERRDYTTFARALERGYAVVVQDVRGRYASEGEFRPYQQEGQDGFDTIEWAAAQSWSNGAVGTFGLSYPGAVQWMAAVENPPHLKAMVPAMTFSSHENFIYARGPFDMSWIEWAWNEIAPDSRARQHLAGPSNFDEAVAAWSREGPRMESVLPLVTAWTPAGGGPFLLRVAAPPAGGPVVGLGRSADQVRQDPGGGTQPFGLVRRGLRTRGCGGEFLRTAGRSSWPGRGGGVTFGAVGPWREGNGQRSGRRTAFRRQREDRLRQCGP